MVYINRLAFFVVVHVSILCCASNSFSEKESNVYTKIENVPGKDKKYDSCFNVLPVVNVKKLV